MRLESKQIFMKLSLIIPTLNRPQDLTLTLESILSQVLKPTQIIIVDQSDDDQSQRICSVYQTRWLVIDYYQFTIKSWAQARNFALSRLDPNVEIVVFLDDDVSFESSFLGNLNQYIASNIDIIGWTWKINSPTRSVSFAKKLWLRLLGAWRNSNQQVVRKTWFNQLFTTQPDIEQQVQRLSGCGMRYRRYILDMGYRFPDKFLKYSIMEDLFLSYQIYRDYPELLTYTTTAEMTHHESLNRSIPNYQKIRQHCVHRYLFHKQFTISIFWYYWTIFLLMILDIITFHSLSVIREYYSSLVYIHQNHQDITLNDDIWNKFIFDL